MMLGESRDGAAATRSVPLSDRRPRSCRSPLSVQLRWPQTSRRGLVDGWVVWQWPIGVVSYTPSAASRYAVEM